MSFKNAVKIFCLLLALSLVASVFPFTASAQEPALGTPTVLQEDVSLSGDTSAVEVQAISNSAKTQEILKKIYALRQYKTPANIFKITPAYSSAPYIEGLMTDSYLQNITNHVNYARYVAGLPDVKYDVELSKNAQFGSTLMAATGVFAHSVPSANKPADMPETFFNAGNGALGSSNIGRGHGSQVLFNYSCLNDSSAGNISGLGHRCWLLSAQMGKIGFGRTDTFSATKIMDVSGAGLAAGSYVTWPAAGVFPLELVDSTYSSNDIAWSFHYNSGDYTSDSTTGITLTRRSDKKAWKFGAAGGGEFYKGDGYGYYNTLIFRPDTNVLNRNTYKAGDIFDVVITGLKKKTGSSSTPVTISYNVTIIDTTLLSNLKISPESATVGVGDTKTLSAVKTPAKSLESITWSSSDKSVATVSSAGIVTAKKSGTATITAKAINGKKATCKITVSALSKYVSLRIGKSRAIQNGTKTVIDSAGTKPMKISKKTMLPIRFVSEKMGAKVTYKNDKEPITIVYGTKTVKLTLNSKKMTVTEKGKSETITLEAPAQKVKGKTFVPLRAIGQALGFNVYYQSGTEIIVISTSKPTTAVLNARLAEAKAYITK